MVRTILTIAKQNVWRKVEKGKKRKKQFLDNLLWILNSNKIFILTETSWKRLFDRLCVYVQLLLSLWENLFYRTHQFVTDFIWLRGPT